MEDFNKLEVGRFQSTPITVSAETPTSKIIGLLKEANSYEVFTPVNKRIGMITTRDILSVSNIGITKASKIIRYVPILAPTDKLIDAARIMSRYHIRALPIVENDNLTGAINIISILQELRKGNHVNAKISSIMTPQPITVNPQDSAMKAKKLMMRKRLDHLPVMNGGVLQGVLTSSHIMYHMIPAAGVVGGYMGYGARGVLDIKKLEFPVGEAMGKEALTFNVDEKISTVLDRMLAKGSSYAILSLLDEVQGIVTYRDFMKLIPNLEEKLSVPTFIIGLPDDPFEAELAKKKFAKVVHTLSKSFPFIEEARSTIKTSAKVAEKERKRYEVDISIFTPKDRYSFSQTGWDLAVIYDELTSRLKRLMTEKKSPRHRKQMVYGER